MSAYSILRKADEVSNFTIAKIPKTNRQFYRVLHRIADTATPKVRRQFLEAIDSIRGTTRVKELREALEVGSSIEVFTALGVDKLGLEMSALVTTLREAYNKAAIEAGKILPKEIQAGFRFDMFNPRAVDYARLRAAELVSQVSDSTRRGIQRVIAEGVESGLTVQQQASRIKEMLGLTPRQVSALDNFKQMLTTEGRKPAQIKRMVNRQKNRMLRSRATAIARTETINAVNAGQEEIWAQAMDQGLIDFNARKKWVVTPDDLLCPICKPIPKNNPGGVPIGTPFQTSVGPRMRPAAHPNCRCSMSLET